jgi:hypothetical protein
MQPSSSDSPHACICTPVTCQSGCALQVIDSLLREPQGVSGEQVDALLDLRFMLRHGHDAEAILKLFCPLRLAMESSHYLAFYRLRRWLENHIEAQVRVCRGLPETAVPLKLDRFCLEAVRSQCLAAALRPGERLLAPRVQFQFRVAVPGNTALLVA